MRVCPECGGQVSDTAKACGHCGHWMEAASQVSPDVPEGRPQPPSPKSSVPVSPPSSEPVVAPRRSLPGVVWAIGGLVLVVIVAVALLASGAIRLPGAAPAATATSRPVPTSLPRPTSAPVTEDVEPVTVMLNGDQEQVAAETPVILRMGWTADTPELVSEYTDALQVSVALDGESLPGTGGDLWGQSEMGEDRDGDGDADYTAYWHYPVGVLDPGSHTVVTTLTLRRTVTDGMDMDGDGEPDEYAAGETEWVLEIVVEE